MPIDETLISVHREWNGCRTAEIRLRDLQEIHWFQPPGAPRPLMHAYVSCASIVSGDMPHDCDRSGGPHRLLVCVLKKHTLPSAYMELTERAREQRMSPSSGYAPLSATTR